jgi:hypothetical protein
MNLIDALVIGAGISGTGLAAAYITLLARTAVEVHRADHNAQRVQAAGRRPVNATITAVRERGDCQLEA